MDFVLLVVIVISVFGISVNFAGGGGIVTHI
jgi:hypothetical protein